MRPGALLDQGRPRPRASETKALTRPPSSLGGAALGEETGFVLSSLPNGLPAPRTWPPSGMRCDRGRRAERPGAIPPALSPGRRTVEEEDSLTSGWWRPPRRSPSPRSPSAPLPQRELAAAERRLAEGAKAAAARAGRVARLREQVGAADSRTVAAQEEMDRLEVSAAEGRERAALAQDEYEQMQDLAGPGKTGASWPPRTSRPPRSSPSRPNGPRFSAPPNVNQSATWPPGGPGPRRWPKPPAAARTPPRRCSPTRPGSVAWSARSPRGCGWPRDTRWRSPRPWAPPPRRWR